MNSRPRLFVKLNDCRGVTAIIIAILMVVFISFAALAVDVSHLYVVRNELQNASDAGALAGARELYNDDGTAVNTGANQIAYDTATSNKSENVLVDVNWAGGNDGDVQRGHWSFATREFTANESTAPADLWNVTTAELDADVSFINAVRVISRRQNTPAASFFASIFGYSSFTKSAEAVAYIGFAGSLAPEDAEMPIAICRDSLLTEDTYSCSIGRMINSGPDPASNETGGWTSFDQDDPDDPYDSDPCQGGTNANELKQIIDPPGPEQCYGKNPEMIYLGADIATLGGEAEAAFKKLRTCWESATNKTKSWNLTLPVIECPGSNVGTCEELVGAVSVNVVWITGEGTDPEYKQAPTQMDDWSFAANADNTNGQERWESFIHEDNFNLKNADGNPAPYQKKAIYFHPDCVAHVPAGRTGGENFGVLAEIPVLVD